LGVLSAYRRTEGLYRKLAAWCSIRSENQVCSIRNAEIENIRR
jgi:hypothetical protein